MENHLVIRFSSLGDLCVLGWSFSAVAESVSKAGQKTTLVTKPAFAPLMRQMKGVDEVISLEKAGMSGLWGLARVLRQKKWTCIFDAHGVLRSRALLMMMGQGADRRINKDTSARLAMLQGRSQDQLAQRTMRQRFDEVFGHTLAGTPTPPLAHLRPSSSSPQVLGLAPGAQWDTKRWPEENFARLLDKFRSFHPAPVRIFLGPREEAWFTGSALARATDNLPQVEVIRQKSLVEVAALLAQCTALVTNDSGLLHLAEATGTPVLAFFGPTVRHFGYFPTLEASEVLEVSLDCRPCSRNGKRPCHRQDLACLKQISPDQTETFLTRMFPS